MLVSPRIKTIGDFISSYDKVADVGADHGLLEIYLLAKYKDIEITAIENKVGPFKILGESLKGYKNVHLSLTDGISGIPNSINTVVIAGMGGCNIEKILNKSKEKLTQINKIVIDAHRDSDIARRTIVNFGFSIENEKIVYDQGKFYVVSVFVKSNKPHEYSEDELDFGYKLYKDKLWPKYKEFLLERNEKVLNEIKNNLNAKDKIFTINKLNERINNYGKD